jgi:hypothetical protein
MLKLNIKRECYTIQLRGANLFFKSVLVVTDSFWISPVNKRFPRISKFRFIFLPWINSIQFRLNLCNRCSNITSIYIQLSQAVSFTEAFQQNFLIVAGLTLSLNTPFFSSVKFNCHGIYYVNSHNFEGPYYALFQIFLILLLFTGIIIPYVLFSNIPQPLLIL